MADVDLGKALRRYIKAINAELVTGKAGERTHYPALKELVEGCRDNITAHIEQTGKRETPDMPVDRRGNRIGVIEAKDPNISIEGIEADAAAGKADHNAEQFITYLAEYDNLLYTNYVEWRLYRRHDAAPTQVAVLAHVGADGKVHTTKDGREAFENLIGAFLAARPEPHATAKGLALDMARLTKVLDADTRQALDEGNDFLKRLYGVFQDELIHGLKADEFADMYAQTIAYGLFTARILHAGYAGGGDFDRFAAERLLPTTNPFLRRVFRSLVDDQDMPKRVVGTVEDLAALIGAADMSSIAEELARFGKRRSRDDDIAEYDPVIYFYEQFLRAYDPEKAKKRGVYYTPLPVVRYIVRSIDELLKSEFDLPDGLADPNIIILDPACGTGTFLYEVVRLIHERHASRGAAEWNEYVSGKEDGPGLLERLFGFELLMAPYTIAHLKLAELLSETGYEFREGQRLGIYLTNTLEEAEQHVEQKVLPGIMGAISREKEGADRVKAEEPVMVVLGNPPYFGFSCNKNPWIDNLMEDYKVTIKEEERQIQRVSNDYVKFIRFAHWRISETGNGIVGMITDRGYSHKLLFRDMRAALTKTFRKVFFLDLHGESVREAPVSPDDENVFEITQGVGISILIKTEPGEGKVVVNYSDLRGPRKAKYSFLERTIIVETEWAKIDILPPNYRFVPEPKDDLYASWYSLTDILGTGNRKKDKSVFYGSGIKTRHDKFVIGFDEEEAVSKVKRLANRPESDVELKSSLKLCKTAHFDIKKARVRAAADDLNAYVKKLNYRPFDTRYIVYLREFICEPKFELMNHLKDPYNIALLSLRQDRSKKISGFFVGSGLIAKDYISDKDDAIVCPFYIRGIKVLGNADDKARKPNISIRFITELLNTVGANTLENSHEVGLRSGSREFLYPEDIFYYIYGVLHSPTYRERYAEFLKLDFPRIPLPKDYESFDCLAAAGQRLSELHLLKDKDRWGWRGIEQRGVAIEAVVGKVEYDEKNEEIIFDARKPRDEQYRLGPIPKHVWEFHVGGYQVLRKWLTDRKGRKVAPSDYVPIVIALAETDRIMKEECDPAFKEMTRL